MKRDVLVFIDNLPALPYEKKEIRDAFERASGIYWVKARQEIKELCSSRIEEKQDRRLKALLTEDKTNLLVPCDEVLFGYIEELWNYGYSSAAISKGLNYSYSAARISQRLEPVSKRKRGQVIELLEDFITEFDLEKWRLKTTPTYKQGPKITDLEKQQFRLLYSKGYSIQSIAEQTGRSEGAIRKWVK